MAHSRKPLAIDMYCGLGGWTEGLLAEGYDVVGFDIERHQYGEHRYPAQLVVQDVLTLHGSQFRNAALIVASPPCQFFSYCAMPWSRAKALARAVRADPERTDKELALFRACFRIQREACEAAGRHIPMVVENVRGATPWVGRARWNYGSFYLWGDVPALMPFARYGVRDEGAKLLRSATLEFARLSGNQQNDEAAFKVAGFRFDGSGRSFQTAAVAEGFKSAGMNWSDPTLRGQDFTRIAGMQTAGIKGVPHRTDGHWSNPAENGTKNARHWGSDGPDALSARTNSKSPARKAASAMIAKIPFAISRHIAAVYRPQ